MNTDIFNHNNTFTFPHSKITSYKGYSIPGENTPGFSEPNVNKRWYPNLVKSITKLIDEKANLSDININGYKTIDTISDFNSINIDDYPAVYVRGYHSPNDGGGGLFIYNSTIKRDKHNGGTIFDPTKSYTSTTNQNWFYNYSNNYGCYERVFESKTLDIRYFGAIGDGYLTNSSYSYNGINFNCRKYQGSDNYWSLYYSAIFVNSSDYDLYIPKGVFYSSSVCPLHLLDLYDVTIYGHKFSSVLVNFYFLIQDCKNLQFDSITIRGEIYDYDITSKYNLTDDYALRDTNGFLHLNDIDKVGFNSTPISITIPTYDYATENIELNNCYFSSCFNGFGIHRSYGLEDDDLPAGDGRYCRNVNIHNCLTTYNIGHGMSSRYVYNIIIDSCIFYKNFSGMMVDFSTGTRNSMLTNCIGINQTNFFKNEIYNNEDGTYKGLNYNCNVSNNFFYQLNDLVSFSTTSNYMFKANCKNVTVSNNTIIANSNLSSFARVRAENTRITNNTFVLNNSCRFLINITELAEFSGSSLIDSNIIENNKEIIYSIRHNSDGELHFKNNLFRGFALDNFIYSVDSDINCHLISISNNNIAIKEKFINGSFNNSNIDNLLFENNLIKCLNHTVFFNISSNIVNFVFKNNTIDSISKNLTFFTPSSSFSFNITNFLIQSNFFTANSVKLFDVSFGYIDTLVFKDNTLKFIGTNSSSQFNFIYIDNSSVVDLFIVDNIIILNRFLYSGVEVDLISDCDFSLIGNNIIQGGFVEI